METAECTLEEKRYYHIRILLADTTTPVQLFVNKLLEVYSSDGRLLGTARLEYRNQKIFADLAIEYASEERLLAETQAEKRWVWIVGEMKYTNQYCQGVSDNGSAGLDIERAVPTLYVEELVVSSVPRTTPSIGVLEAVQ